MLTDAFFRRYERIELFARYTDAVRKFFGQAVQIITDDLFPRDKINFKEAKRDPGVIAQAAAHKKLARELGVEWLINPRFNHTFTAPNGNTVNQTYDRTMENTTKLFLTQPITEQLNDDAFIKLRVSFIELCFQEQVSYIDDRRQSLVKVIAGKNTAIDLYDALNPAAELWANRQKREIEGLQTTFDNAVIEMNARFRQANMRLSYHNGLIQVSDDALVEEQVERPFWTIVSQPKWQNVDQLIKEAIDRRDRSERDSVTPAMQALESVIKIISTDKGWNTGKEKGAANFIDNLVAERNGKRFIEVWEKDALVHLFGRIRNSFGHGPGSHPLPTLLPEQADWAIETSMVWVKSLIRRY